ASAAGSSDAARAARSRMERGLTRGPFSGGRGYAHRARGPRHNSRHERSRIRPETVKAAVTFDRVEALPWTPMDAVILSERTLADTDGLFPSAVAHVARKL